MKRAQLRRNIHALTYLRRPVFAGVDDHFVPLDQVEEYKKSLVHARSVSAVVFDRASGGSEHCQLGAPRL